MNFEILKNGMNKLISRWKMLFRIYLDLRLFLEILIILLVFIIFKKPLELFIENTFVKFFFQYFESDDYALFSWIIINVIFTLSVFKLGKKWLPWGRTSFKQAIVLVFICVTYLVSYRSNQVWTIITLTDSGLLKHFKYADIIFSYTAFNFISWIFYLSRQKVVINDNMGFIEDSHITEVKQDDLDYKDYAKVVSEELSKTYPSKSICIGVNGQWGSGKTSFIYLLVEHFRDNPTITSFWFNPWESASLDRIKEDFFNKLLFALPDENRSLRDLFLKYANQINALSPNIYSRLSSFFTLSKSSHNEKYKNRIGNILKVTGQRIIVLIDDLDRLDAHELADVFKIVRNSANFNNIIFILAYDRNYIDKTIAEKRVNEDGMFLNKIVQTEINLPFLRREKLVNQLVRNIQEILVNNDEQKITKGDLNQIEDEIRATLTVQRFHGFYFDYFIKNLRDVVRLTNSLKVSLPKIYKEVYFPDLLLLEMLKLRYPVVYGIIQTRWYEILNSPSSFGNNLYTLTHHEIEGKPVIEKILKDLNIVDLEIKMLMEFIRSMFNDKHNNKVINRINSEDKFHTYFSYSLSQDEFSDAAYERLKNGAYEAFLSFVNNCIISGSEKQLIKRLEEESTERIPSKLAFENIMKSIFELTNLKSEVDNHLPYFIPYQHRTLLFWMFDFDLSIRNKFYKGQSLELKAFYIKLLRQCKESGYAFSSELSLRLREFAIQDELSDTGEKPLFSSDDLVEINIFHLKELIETASKYNYQVEAAYFNCYIKRLDDLHRLHHFPLESQKLIKSFVFEKNLVFFLMSFIRESPNGRRTYRKYSYSLNEERVNSFFLDFSDFLNLLDQNNWRHIDEYVEFYRKYNNQAESKTAISYDFSNAFLTEYKKFKKEFYLPLELH